MEEQRTEIIKIKNPLDIVAQLLMSSIVYSVMALRKVFLNYDPLFFSEKSEKYTVLQRLYASLAAVPSTMGTVMKESESTQLTILASFYRIMTKHADKIKKVNGLLEFEECWPEVQNLAKEFVFSTSKEILAFIDDTDYNDFTHLRLGIMSAESAFTLLKEIGADELFLAESPKPEEIARFLGTNFTDNDAKSYESGTYEH